MTFSLSIYGVTGLALGVIGLFATATLALATRPGEARPWFLCAFLAGLSVSILMSFLEDVGALESLFLFLLCTVLPFISGPALYLYARQAFRQGLSLTDGIHLLPLILGLITALNWAQGRFELGNTWIPGAAVMTWSYAFYASSLAYAVMTLRLMKCYETQLHQTFSEMGGRRLLWIRGAAWGLLLLVSTDLVLGILLGAQAISLETTRLVITSLLMALIFGLSLQALKNPAVFISELKGDTGEAKGSYASSGLGEDTLQRWAERLNEEMAEHRLYLENDLTLPQLAQRVRLKPHHLSQVLNQQLGKSFYDYINGARIQFACDLLEHSDQSVLDIAFASGYNNKASFHKAFNQHVHTTPLKYRKQQADETQPRTRVA